MTTSAHALVVASFTHADTENDDVVFSTGGVGDTLAWEEEPLNTAAVAVDPASPPAPPRVTFV